MDADHITKAKHDKPTPKHPEAGRWAYLFNGFKPFKESVEQPIEQLLTAHDRGMAWEVWCEGFLVVVEGLDPANLWLQTRTMPSLERERLDLPKEDFGIDSVYLSLNDDAYQFKFRTGRPLPDRDNGLWKQRVSSRFAPTPADSGSWQTYSSVLSTDNSAPPTGGGGNGETRKK